MESRKKETSTTVTTMKEIHNNQEIPIPEGLEQRLSALVDRLEAEEKEQGMKN